MEGEALIVLMDRFAVAVEELPSLGDLRAAIRNRSAGAELKAGLTAPPGTPEARLWTFGRRASWGTPADAKAYGWARTAGCGTSWRGRISCR